MTKKSISTIAFTIATIASFAASLGVSATALPQSIVISSQQTTAPATPSQPLVTAPNSFTTSQNKYAKLDLNLAKFDLSGTSPDVLPSYKCTLDKLAALEISDAKAKQQQEFLVTVQKSIGGEAVKSKSIGQSNKETFEKINIKVSGKAVKKAEKVNAGKDATSISAKKLSNFAKSIDCANPANDASKVSTNFKKARALKTQDDGKWQAGDVALCTSSKFHSLGIINLQARNFALSNEQTVAKNPTKASEIQTSFTNVQNTRSELSKALEVRDCNKPSKDRKDVESKIRAQQDTFKKAMEAYKAIK
jgi:hypothetical protein